MNTKLSLLASLVLALNAACGTTAPNPTTPTPVTPEPAVEIPTAESVLARYIEVTGGEAAYRAAAKTRGTGALEIPSQNIKGDLVVTTDGSNISVDINIPGLGTIRQGSDGTTVWEQNPMSGARIISGGERTQFLRAQDPLRDVEWQRFYKSAKSTSIEEVDGKDAVVVEMIDNDGTAEKRYYDLASGLLVMSEDTVKQQGGDTPSTSRYTDYRAFGTITVPVRIEQSTRAFTVVIVISSYEINPTIDPAVFELPAEIQALRDAG